VWVVVPAYSPRPALKIWSKTFPNTTAFYGMFSPCFNFELQKKLDKNSSSSSFSNFPKLLGVLRFSLKRRFSRVEKSYYILILSSEQTMKPEEF
jgi:hypothetical protein